MNCFEFWASIINSISWPLVVLIISIIFRKPLIGILSNIRKLRVGNSEVEFEVGRTVSEAKENFALKIDKELAEFYDNLAGISPRAVVLVVWDEFQRTAQKVVGSTVDYSIVFDELQSQGLLKETEANSLKRLREFKYRLLDQGENLSEAKIAEYGSVIREITNNLESRIKRKD